MKKSIKEIGCTFKQFQSMPSGKIRPMYCYAATKKGVAKIEDLNSKNSKPLVPKSNDIVMHFRVILNGEYVRQFFGNVLTEDEGNRVLIVLIQRR